MASAEQLRAGSGPKYVQMQKEAEPAPALSGFPSLTSSLFSFHHMNFPSGESARIFDELPNATIIQVSRPDAGDISPMLLTYTIELQYKEVRSRR